MARRRFREVSPELRQAAQALRREMTPAERLLWNGLRGWKVGGGVRFRRQHALGRFVLDFYCPSHRLCVEVDGGVHEGQRDRDAARDEARASVGIRTLRIPNEDVFADLPSVGSSGSSTPHRNPSPLSRLRERVARLSAPGEGPSPDDPRPLPFQHLRSEEHA